VNGWFTKAKKQAEMTKRVYEILDKKGEKISAKGSRSRSVAARSKPTVTVQAGGNILPGRAALGSSDQEQSAVSQALSELSITKLMKSNLNDPRKSSNCTIL